MATIAKLVIQGVLDPTGVKQGVRDSLNEIKKLRKLTVREVNQLSPLNFDLERAGKAQKAIAALTEVFNRETAKAREALFRGQIDHKQFKESGVKSAQDFNNGLLGALDALRSSNSLTPLIERILVSKFKDAGLAAGQQFADAANRKASGGLFGDLSTPGQRAADSLLRTFKARYDARVQNLKEDLVNGVISIPAYRRAAFTAAQEFDKGIETGLSNLRAKGLITDQITTGLVNSYRLAGLRAANAFQLSLDKQMGQNTASIGTALTAAITVPALAAGGAAVKLAGDFELSINRINAILQPTADQLANLKAQARDIGAVSQFSARDAAQAQEQLARQGFSVQEILKTMPSVLDVAAASLVSMSDAATKGAVIMRTYNLTAEEFASATDKIVFTTNNTSANLDDMTSAFRTVAPQARLAGVSFNEIATALGVLAKAGLKGTLGGTALRGILARLIAPTNDSREALEKMGIQVFDANKKMRSLVDIVQQFEVAQKRIGSDEGFIRAVQSIFQQRTGAGFGVLLQAGSKTLGDFEKQLNSVGGTAKRVGEVQMSGFVGAIREFISVVEELGLAIADSGLLKAVTSVVRSLAEFVRGLSRLNPAVLDFGVKLGLALAVFGPMLLAVGKTLTLFATFRSLLVLINGPAALAGLAASLATGGAVLVGLGLLAGLLLKTAFAAAQARIEMAQFTSSLSGQSLDGLKDMESSLQAMIQAQEAIVNAASTSLDSGRGEGFGSLKGLSEAGAKLKVYREQLAAVKDAIRKIEFQPHADPITSGAIDAVREMADLLGELDLDLEGGTETKTVLEQMNERVSLFGELLDGVKDRHAQLPGLANQLAGTYDVILDLLAAQSGALDGTTAGLLKIKGTIEELAKRANIFIPVEMAAKLQEAADKLKGVEIKIKMTPSGAEIQLDSVAEQAVARFQRLVDRNLSIKLNIELAEKAGQFGRASVLQDQFRQNVAALRIEESNLAATLLASNVPLERRKEILQQITQALVELGIIQDSVTKTSRKFAKEIEGALNAVTGIANILDSVGALDDKWKDVISSTNDAVRAYQDYAEAVRAGQSGLALAGGAIGIAGGVINAIQALLRDAEKSEVARLTQENSQEIAKLTLELRNFRSNQLGDVLDVRSKLPELSAKLAQAIGNNSNKALLAKIPVVFDRAAQQLVGLSLAQIQALADQFDIKITDKDGNIVFSQLQKLAEAIDLNVQKLIKFGTSLDAQSRKLSLKRNVFNLDSTGAGQIQDQLQLLQQFAPKLGEMFAGMDATTADGRRQIEAALQALFTMLENNILVAADFGLLGGAEDLATLIETIANALDTFKESINGVNEELVNIPKGLKVEQLRFDATTAASIPIKDSGILPNTSVPTISQTSNSFSFGDIIIQAGDRDGEALVDEFMLAMRRRARAQTGDPRNWASL